MSNKNFTMTFEPRDVPWLLHAFGIQSNTALMCGEPDTKNRIDFFKNSLKSMFPVLCSYDIEDGPMFTCMTAMLKGKHWTIYRKCDRYGYIRDKKWASILVEVDDEIYEITRSGVDDELLEGIHLVLVECAPITCEYYEKT